MAPARLVFTITGDAIPPRHFADAVRLFAQLLDDVDSAHSATNQPTMRWRLGELGSGSAVVPYIGTPRQANVQPNVNVPLLCVRGLRELQNDVTKPSVFRREAIRRVHEIGRMIRNGMSGIRVEAHESGVHADITPTVVANAARFLTKHDTLGAVEGWLEEINIHVRPLRFTVWDDVYGQSVRCRFDEGLLDDVVHALRSKVKVLVAGRVQRDPDGRPREVSDITELRQLVPEFRRRSVLELEGVYSAMEGDTLDYLAEIRGE